LGEKPIVWNPNRIKIFKWKKANFWKKLFTLDNNKFDHFKPLFLKIEELFNS
jgi:hypothetical protein